MEQVEKKTIHITHCPTEEMVADFFTKPLQGSLFTKIRDYIMGIFTGVSGEVMQHLPLVQCASVVDMIDEGKIVLIMSQYAHKPDSKIIHSKSQVEHFDGIVYDLAKAGGGYQMIVTHEGYAIPLHVQNGLYYISPRERRATCTLVWTLPQTRQFSYLFCTHGRYQTTGYTKQCASCERPPISQPCPTSSPGRR